MYIDHIRSVCNLRACVTFNHITPAVTYTPRTYFAHNNINLIWQASDSSQFQLHTRDSILIYHLTKTTAPLR